MQSDKRLFVVAVAILVINIMLFLKIGDLRNQLDNLHRNYDRLQSSMDTIAGDVNQSLAQFVREQGWISAVQVNEEKTSVKGEQGLAALNWQIKDYPEGAEVVLHYRQESSAEFKEISAVNKRAGYFEAVVPIQITVEPFWAVEVSKTSKSGTAVRESAIPKKLSVDFEYYVSMKTKDTIKSSEISSFDVGYLAKVKYEAIQGHIEVNDHKYTISLVENPDFKSVLAKFYDGSDLITQKVMHVPADQKGLRSYFLSYDPGSRNVSHVVIQVQYVDGKTFSQSF